MTSVLGHLTNLVFGEGYNDWRHPTPDRLFDAPVEVKIDEVCKPNPRDKLAKQLRRIKNLLRRISRLRHAIPTHSSFGPIVTGKESI